MFNIMMFRHIIISCLLTALSCSLPGGERLVSLSPNLTEIIFKLGQGQQLVGRSSVCDYPQEALKLPIVGKFGIPYLEPMIALQPTLVVTEKVSNNAFFQDLVKYQIKYQVFANESLDDYLKIVTALGKILNCEKEAARLVSRTQAQIDALRNAAKQRRYRPKVLVLISDAPLITTGRKSFISEMIELAGGHNIGDAEERGFFTCSLEWINKNNPDIIIMPRHATSKKVADLQKNPAWSSLAAFKNQHIITDIDDSILYRLGPRTVDGILLLKSNIDKFYQSSSE